MRFLDSLSEVRKMEENSKKKKKHEWLVRQKENRAVGFTKLKEKIFRNKGLVNCVIICQEAKMDIRFGIYNYLSW